MSTIYTPGFDGDIMVATNVDFGLPTGTAQKMITVGGQLMIGTGNVYPLQEIAAGFITAGPGISVSYTGGNIEITNIVPPSPFILTPDIGVNIVNTVFNFNGFGGLETFGFTATDLQIQDKRWLSAFVVDPSTTFGQEAEYTTIQAAITAATAPAVVYVRANAAPYVENLTFKAGVDVVGVDADGRSTVVGVEVQGNHTFSGNGTSIIENLRLYAPAGDALVISPAPIDNSIFISKNCTITSDVGRTVFCNPGVGASALFISQESDLNSLNQCVDLNGTSSCSIIDSNLISSASNAFRLASSQTVNVFRSSMVCGLASVSFAGVGGTVNIRYSNISNTTQPNISLGASGGTYAGSNNVYTCNDVGNFYISGTGTYVYSDETIKGAATAIDPTVTQTIDVWRPHSQAGAAPGTGVARGTAAFDVSQFTVTDGFVQLAAGASGITTLDANDTTSTTGTTILLDGIAGIETGNAGAGVIEISNKRFFSPYVVDPSTTFGTRGEYSTIQAAINAANLAGGGTVFIRQGTYTEDLTLQPNVDLAGIPVDGRASAVGATNLVTIDGSHTLSSAGTVGISNIDFVSTVSDTFTINNAAGNSFLGLKYCSINSSGGISNIAMNVPAGATSQVAAEYCNLFSDSDCVITNGLGTCNYTSTNSFYNSSGGSVISLSAPSTSSFISNCRAIGFTNAISIAHASALINLESNVFIAPIGVDFVAAGTVVSLHNSWQCNSGSNYVVGSGTYVYGDDLLIGTANAIDVATTQQKIRWRGRAEAGALGVAYEGVASFDSADFVVTDGFVQLAASGGITTLDANDTTSTTGTTILLDGIAGIETGNAGAGVIEISNKRFNTPYVVDPSVTFGTRGEYSTVQAAINAASLAGGGTVLIREGTYNENLTFLPGVNLIGFQNDGRVPAVIAKVVINGNHICSVSSGFNIIIINEISLTCATGDTLTLTATGGSQLIFAGKFSGVDATNDPASRAVVLDADITSAVQFSTDNTQISASSHAFETIGAGSGSAAISLGGVSSNSGDVFRHSSGSGSFVASFASVNSSNYVFNGVVANGSVNLNASDVFSSLETIIFPAGNGQAQVYHCNINCQAGSGFWIDGTGGQLNFADVVLLGSATGIGASITQQKQNWQPYGEDGPAPGTGVPRGTAAFDDTQFLVTDGFVQLIGGPAGITSLVADDATATTASVVDLQGIAGIETGNATASTIDISNKRFISPYVVDPSVTFGTRGEYSTVQAAINAASLAGGGVVYIRPGTYVENLTLAAGVEIVGLNADGRLPSGFAKVEIQGNHSMTAAGLFVASDIQFSSAAGDVFTISPAASVAALLLKSCSVFSAAIGFVLTPSVGAAAQLELDTTNVTAVNQAFDLYENSQIGVTQGSIQSANDEAIRAAGSSIINTRDTTYNSPTNTISLQDPVQFTADYCQFEAGLSCINMTDAGAYSTARHCTFNAGNVSTYFVDGIGTFDFANVINMNNVVINIDPAVTQIKRNWQPYGEAGAAPGTGVPRGTAAFDSAQFNVTDGFVQLIGGGSGTTGFLVQSGTSPVVPDGLGQVTVTASTVPASAIPIQTVGTSANSFDVQVQYSSATGVSTPSANGVSHYDSGQFNVDVNGFVQLGGSVPIQFPVDQGGPGVPSAGSLSLVGTTSTDFSAPYGIETHVGANTNEIFFEERRWLSNFVVDPSTVVGERGTFSTISAALTAANPTGGTVYVRPGTYAEDITLVDDIHVIGATGDGKVGSVILDGRVLVSGTRNSIQNFLVQPTTAGQSPLILTPTSNPGDFYAENCVFDSSSTTAVTVDFASGSGEAQFFNCEIIGVTTAVIRTQVSSTTRLRDCVLDAPVNIPVIQSITTGSQFYINDSQLSSNGNIWEDTAGSFMEMVFANCTSSNESFNLNNASAGLRLRESIVQCTAGSGDFIIGTGSMQYADIVLPGSARNINGTITATVNDWKPYGTAGTSLTAVRGTAGYDNTQFTVTNGFVQLVAGAGGASSFPTDSGTATQSGGTLNVVGGPGITTSGSGNTVTINSVVFTDQAGSVTVTKNSGTYSTGAGSLVFTLPVTAGLVNGDLCAFCLAGSTDITITANTGQTIQWGTNVTGVGGSINTAQDGSFMVLRFRVASQRWYAESIVGNWT